MEASRPPPHPDACGENADPHCRPVQEKLVSSDSSNERINVNQHSSVWDMFAHHSLARIYYESSKPGNDPTAGRTPDKLVYFNSQEWLMISVLSRTRLQVLCLSIQIHQLISTVRGSTSEQVANQVASDQKETPFLLLQTVVARTTEFFLCLSNDPIIFLDFSLPIAKHDHLDLEKVTEKWDRHHNLISADTFQKFISSYTNKPQFAAPPKRKRSRQLLRDWLRFN